MFWLLCLCLCNILLLNKFEQTWLLCFFTGGCRDNLYSSSYPSSSFYYTKREAACIVSWQSLFLFSLSCGKANYSSEPGYKKHWELHKVKASFSDWQCHYIWAIWEYYSVFCSKYVCMYNRWHVQLNDTCNVPKQPQARCEMFGV